MTPRFLVTAGPTREYLDPVRFLSNPSSGRMGYAIARAALRAGARVTLVSGPVALEAPAGARLVRVESAGEMRRAVRRLFRGADVVIMAAAVADYRPRRRLRRKMKKGAGAIRIEMVRTADILAGLGRSRRRAFLVGFAAETGNPVAEARRKLRAKRLDMIVANDISRPGAGFGSDFNEAFLIDRAGGIERIPLTTKAALARRVVRRCMEAARGARGRGHGAGGRTRTGTPAEAGSGF